MSSLRYNKICTFCGAEFIAKISHARFCSHGCMAKHHRPPKPLVESTCNQCGAEFTGRMLRLYCSTRCGIDYRKTKTIGNKVRRITPPKRHTCKQCGIAFMANYRPVYCSAECKKTNLNDRAKLAYPGRYIRVKPQLKQCLQCGTDFTGHKNHHYCSLTCVNRSNAERAGAKPLSEWKHGTCAKCSAPIERLNPRDKYCDDCKRPKARRCRKVAVMKKNGMQAGLTRDQVLNRDGWRCYICGVDTPKELSGKNKPNSPEIEHIVPIVKGGTHTSNNVACVCQTCNRSKGDKITMPCRMVTNDGLPIMPEYNG